MLSNSGFVRQTLDSIDALASLLDEKGWYAEAEALFRESLQARRRSLGNDHPATLRSTGNLGFILNQQGKPEEAEPLYRATLAGLRELHGNDHPHTRTSVGNLAALLGTLGKHDEAEPLYHESLEGRRRLLGDDHPSTLNAIYNMGDMLQRRGKLEQADPFCHQALEGYRRIGGDDHIGTLYSLTNLGHLLMRQGKPSQAQPYLEEAVERRRSISGDDHLETSVAVEGIAVALEAQHRWSDAESWRRLLHKLAAGAKQTDEMKIASHLTSLGENLFRQALLAEAEAVLVKSVSIYQKSKAAEDCRRWKAQSMLGEVLAADPGRYAEAERLLLEAADRISSPREVDDCSVQRVAEAQLRLVGLYDAWGKLEMAARWRSRATAAEARTTSD